jgi:hypothetical protein
VLQFRSITLDPSPDGDVIHREPTLGQKLLDVAVGKREAQIPADRQENDIRFKLAPLEQAANRRVQKEHPTSLSRQACKVATLPACPRNDVQKHIRDYLVAVTLRKYDDATARAMPEVLSDVVNAAQNEISMFAHRPGDATDPEDVKETARFLDRLENQYFERMRKVLKARDQN